MGRSAGTCLKLITCASDSADSDGFEAPAPESKCSSDRRGWSFRKRSARHRVLSNTVTSETQSGNKESPETAAGINSQTQTSSGIPGKTSTEQLNSNFPDKNYSTEPPKIYSKEPVEIADEKASIVEGAEEKPQPPNNKVVETVSSEVGDHKDELILKELDVIVIQAAIRGFLAQNSLLKHKNVVKLQAAIRGHVVRRHAVGTLRCVQAIIKMQALVRARRAQYSNVGMENSSKKLQSSYTSIEKLLSNKFATQLLESSPRNKTINIKCDPSKSDSAWIWLERWMSVSTRLSPSTEVSAEQLEKKEVEDLENHLEAGTHPETQSASKDVSVVPSESCENLITYEADSLAFPVFDSVSEENDSFPVKTETDHEEQHSTKRIAAEELDEKKFLFGSRKAFIAAQSKFEELSLSASSGKAASLPSQETETEHFTDTISSVANNLANRSEICLPDTSVLHTSVLVVGSECSTELSISSTLDSPDRYEVRVQDFELEAKACLDTTTVYHHKGDKDLDIDDHDQTNSQNEPGRHAGSNSDSGHTGTVVAPDMAPEEQKTETPAILVQTEPGSEMGCQVFKATPDRSPRSHVTFPESHSTPSSKVSAKPKVRSEKIGSNRKHRISSIGNRSPSNPNEDAATASLDQLPKDQRSGKRRNSFGSAKSEQADQEPRDSNASNSVPSYMQATESARAKAIANSSPKSSPDTHNKEVYVKKRHSLPGSNGRQGSPRIQRSLSQAQQNTKGNGTHSPQEKRWQR